MIFSLLSDDDEKSRILIEDFLLENEPFCVSLVSRFLQKDAKIFFAEENRKIAAVFSFSKGKQLLFQIEKKLSPGEKKILNAAVKKAFEKYFPGIFSVMGTLEDCNEILKNAEDFLKRNPVHTQEYDLMIFDEKEDKNSVDFLNSKQNLKSEDEIFNVCCGISDFEEIFPLQKSYELEEVVFLPGQFNENAAKLLLKKNLERKKIFALKKAGKFVSKLSISARGKNCVQLGGIFTVPEFRNHGFAKILLMSFCKKYSSAGKKIVLFVKKSNAAAHALYLSCGFKKIGGYKIAYF